MINKGWWQYHQGLVAIEGCEDNRKRLAMKTKNEKNNQEHFWQYHQGLVAIEGCEDNRKRLAMKTKNEKNNQEHFSALIPC